MNATVITENDLQVTHFDTALPPESRPETPEPEPPNEPEPPQHTGVTIDSLMQDDGTVVITFEAPTRAQVDVHNGSRQLYKEAEKECRQRFGISKPAIAKTVGPTPMHVVQKNGQFAIQGNPRYKLVVHMQQGL